jgi:hypothetical protein
MNFSGRCCGVRASGSDPIVGVVVLEFSKPTDSMRPEALLGNLSLNSIIAGRDILADFVCRMPSVFHGHYLFLF